MQSDHHSRSDPDPKTTVPRHLHTRKRDRDSAFGQILPPPIFLFCELRSHGVAEVRCLKDRPYLNLTGLRHWVGAAPHPLHGLIHTLHLPNPETGNQLVRGRKGPSVTSRSAPSKATPLPCDVGLSPSAESIIPAFTSFSFYLPMASSTSVEGMVPASLSAVALTRTTTRIICILPHYAQPLPRGNCDSADGDRTAGVSCGRTTSIRLKYGVSEIHRICSRIDLSIPPFCYSESAMRHWIRQIRV